MNDNSVTTFIKCLEWIEKNRQSTRPYQKLRGVFYNSLPASCSIYASGKMCYDILKQSSHFDLAYIETQGGEIDNDADFLIVNYHFTVCNWITSQKLEMYRGKTYCIVLEVDLCSDKLIPLIPNIFDHYIVLDPTIQETSKMHPFPRPLPICTTHPHETHPIPVIGSFGFATKGKRWDRIFDLVAKEYDQALIRINVPKATFVDDQDHEQVITKEIIEPGNLILQNKPLIRAELTFHHFETQQEIVDWCSQNTINVFLYDRSMSTGLAAVTDQAILAERPLLVSDHPTFRHIHPYISHYPALGLREAIATTGEGVRKMKDDWSHEKFLQRFESLLSQTITNKKPNFVRYLAGGKFGDFIYSLSVVNEIYLRTGQKGVIYLSNRGDVFTYGLESTYNDTKDIIALQDYVHSYHIHQGEAYDVDLTEWRTCDYVSQSYPQTLSDQYHVPWGKHPWITNIPKNEFWEDKVVIWTIEKRFPYSLQWARCLHYQHNCIFVSFYSQDYRHFCLSVPYMNIPLHQPKSLMELFVILNSCKCFMGSYSGFLAAAFSLHTECFIGEFGIGEKFSKDFEKFIPNVHVDFYDTSLLLDQQQ